MSKVVKCGLIQCANALDADEPVEKIRDAMIEKHIPFIEQAAAEGVKILCFQEVFNGPYFCPSQDTKWYGLAELIPDGPSVKIMQEFQINCMQLTQKDAILEI